MIASALRELDLAGLDMVIVENVGNLVCTAGFDLGEHLRIVVLSVSEGDDKIVKYPAIFQGSQALFITKTDLVELVKFDIGRVTADMKRLAPHAVIFSVSATKGEGIAAAAEWLLQQAVQRM
jgi:hydrogenase nickel incorporation protein HypB